MCEWLQPWLSDPGWLNCLHVRSLKYAPLLLPLQQLPVTLLYFLDVGQFWIVRREYFPEVFTSGDQLIASNDIPAHFALLWTAVYSLGFETHPNLRIPHCPTPLCSTGLPRAFTSWAPSHTCQDSLRTFPHQPWHPACCRPPCRWRPQFPTQTSHIISF